jgi:hypothetical protein
MEIYAQPIQNPWLRPLKSGYLSVALTFRRIFSATISYLKIISFFNYDKLHTLILHPTIFQGIVEGLMMTCNFYDGPESWTTTFLLTIHVSIEKHWKWDNTV